MKTASSKVSANRSGKRSHALKELLEKQETNLLEIKEDLPFEADSQTGNIRTVQFGSDKPASPKEPKSNLSEAIGIFHELIAKEIAGAASHLEISEAELKAWVDLQIEVPARTILSLLRTMQHWYLDPLKDEIGFTQYEDGHWQVFISIDGCSRLLNEHHQFNGLVFNQADTLVEGVPEWIECSIYRRDRLMPITVREYFVEVRNSHELWQKMPRRMLRHRALQQCVRLAIR
ncbi:recombinase RecT [Polynucleobacter sp. MWH-UH23A]|uniref:recombinase RecT n=1 Tax=Polynucleobacter sp. MWH-UH23A TaxID=1855613 RepID=UPI003364F333